MKAKVKKKTSTFVAWFTEQYPSEPLGWGGVSEAQLQTIVLQGRQAQEELDKRQKKAVQFGAALNAWMAAKKKAGRK